MTLLNLEVHLRVVGVFLIMLAGMHVFLPRRFSWSTELARLSLLNRQIFIVHTLFIVLVLVLTGLLSLGFAPLLVQHTPLATILLCGLAIFWWARMAAQLFIYSPKLWRGNRFNTAAHVLFSCLWLYFASVYTQTGPSGCRP